MSLDNNPLEKYRTDQSYKYQPQDRAQWKVCEQTWVEPDIANGLVRINIPWRVLTDTDYSDTFQGTHKLQDICVTFKCML
jgi:hypothetical protein